MSMDKSLKSRASLSRHRNVLTRAERIQVLKDTDRWTDDSSALGLPKVAHRKAGVGKKVKAKQETTEAEKSEEKPKEKEKGKEKAK